MYQPYLSKLLFRFLYNQKQREQRYIELNYQVPEDNILNLSNILKDFVNREVIAPQYQLFYLNPHTNHFIYVDFMKLDIRLEMDPFRQTKSQCKNKQILPDYTLTLLIKNISEVSDETLANPKKPNKKRSKERIIEEAFKCCREWRRLYRQVLSSNSKKTMNLDESAQLVGVARKTLQDYFLQLKNARKLNFNFSKFKNCKMGVLRKFVKQNSAQLNLGQGKWKIKSEHDWEEQRQFFNQIEMEMNVEKTSQQIVQEQYVQQMDVGDFLLFNNCDRSRSENSSESES